MEIRKIILEEINDFDWIKSSEWWRGFTLGDMYDNDKLNRGDVIRVNGLTRGEDGEDVQIDSYVEITDVPNKDWGYDGLEYVTFKPDKQGLKDIMQGQLGKTLNFTKDDENLRVLDYQSRIKESDELSWIKDHEIPLTIFDLEGYKIIHPKGEDTWYGTIHRAVDFDHVNQNRVTFREGGAWGEKYLLKMLRSGEYNLYDKDDNKIDPHRVKISGVDPNQEFDY